MGWGGFGGDEGPHEITIMITVCFMISYMSNQINNMILFKLDFIESEFSVIRVGAFSGPPGAHFFRFF
mgnify:CR=1 FL=1